MAVVDAETAGALGGGAGVAALAKHFWNEFWHRKDKEKIEERMEAMDAKIEKQWDEISENAKLAYEHFASKDDMRSISDHVVRKFDAIDRKIDNMNTLMINVLQERKK